MNSDRDLPCGRGCPIRRSRDHRSLASPPGFSQRATSFIASQCQGIHQMPFSSRLITASPSPEMPHHRRAQGQAPCLAPQSGGGGLYEDTSLGHAWRKRRWRHPRAPAPLALCRQAERCSADRRQAKLRFAERGQALLARPVRLGHITTLSSPFNQPRPRSPAAVSLNLLRTSRPGLSALLTQRLSRGRNSVATVVEVNGFEPMTSCLQSRRSPN